MEIRHHLFDRITMDPAGVREPYSAQIEHFAERGGDAHHRWIVNISERPFDKAALVDRVDLVDEQIRVTSQQQHNERGPGLASARLAGPAAKGYSSS